MNIIEKILKEHLVDNTSKNEVGIKIDQTLTQDATGTMAYLEFEAIGKNTVSTELSVSYVDHNTIQDGFENADDHLYLQSIAEKYGIYFSKAGNGICHQVHLENFAKPGKTLLGSDSHTPTAGGVGMLAIGAGGLDIATALAGGCFYLPLPKVLKIELKGKLSKFVTAKDVILQILQILTTKGNVGYIIEYSGEGLKELSVPERAVITNMGAELGVTSSVFPSDEITKEFLKAQNRENDWTELKADKDAKYDKEIIMNLSELVPMIALPHSPDNVKKVKEVEGLRVDQVLIGSCTNSSYKDLFTVAKLLEGKKANKNVSFAVAPGSKQVLEMMVENGLIKNIIEAGGRILESSCGFCIGMGQSPSSNAVSIRTNNRNFYGRSGTKSAGIYLVSPETAVACALQGEITDPSNFFQNASVEFVQPKQFLVNNSLLINPLPISDRKNIKLIKGPNIGPPPISDKLQNTLKLKVSIKVEDKITTDHIMPAGRFLKYRSNIEKYSEFVFNDVDPNFYKNCQENTTKGFSNIIVAGHSYGQGSSREHAAICPMFLGVKVVICKSIERIHRANLINFGIIPLIFKNEKDYNSLDVNEEIIIEDVLEQINKEVIEIKIISSNKKISLVGNFSQREKKQLLVGGKLNLLKEKI
jgi:aconitate hydratase